MSLKEEKIEYRNKEYRLCIMEMENALVVLFSEGPLKLGTVAVALPSGEAVTSSVLLGGKYLLSTRALAERAAALYKRMVLASVHTQLPEAEAIRLAIDLLAKAVPEQD